MTPSAGSAVRDEGCARRSGCARGWWPGSKRRSPSGLAATISELPTGTVLAVIVGLLCVIGLVMVGSASSVVSISLYGSPWAILIREAMWMAVGVVAFGVAVRFDHRKLRRLAPLLLVVTFFLLLVVLVPGLGVHVQGSSRWIGFGQFRLQPSELMKLALTVFAADLITRRLDEGATDRRIIGPLLLVTASAGLLIVVQPDLGTAMVLGCIVLAMLFVSGVRLGPVLKILAGLVVIALVVAVASPYRRERLSVLPRPVGPRIGSGYQVVQSLIGLGSGHLVGAGLGGGQAQWGFLPNAQTDFIFSVIGEELGFIGAALVLLLLGAFVWFGIRAATRSPDRFGGLLAVGLVAWLASETLINIGAVVGVLPVTGIPLPFISYGGSSLVITMVAAGILINIARQERSTPAARRSCICRTAGSERTIGPIIGRPRARSVREGRGIVIAGGGTGGHVVPSLQIARALVARGHPAATIELFGSRRGQEATLWPTLEFPFTLLPGRGIRRSLRLRALVDNAGAVLGLLWATAAAIVSFLARRPGSSWSSGATPAFRPGSPPCSRGCPWSWSTPMPSPGPSTPCSAASPPRTPWPFPGPTCRGPVLTGTPVRPELDGLDRSPAGRQEARATLGLPEERRTLAAFGGSLGARRINAAVADLAARWSDRRDLSLYHVAGRRDFAQFAPEAAIARQARAPSAAAGLSRWCPSRIGCPSCTGPPTSASAAPGP